MIFNVPQYIDVEDKIAGPLTAKQLLWMIGMGATLFVFWTVLDKETFYVLAIPVVLIFVALAFYRPYDQSLISFIGLGISYLFSPKVYSWKRISSGKIEKIISQTEKEKKEEKKNLSEKDIEELARLLDTEGFERSQIIKEKNQKK